MKIISVEFEGRRGGARKYCVNNRFWAYIYTGCSNMDFVYDTETDKYLRNTNPKLNDEILLQVGSYDFHNCERG